MRRDMRGAGMRMGGEDGRCVMMSLWSSGFAEQGLGWTLSLSFNVASLGHHDGLLLVLFVNFMSLLSTVSFGYCEL